MIVRDLGDAWQVVLQTDHADLSAAFARAWATPLAPSLVVATERHDDGWAVWEQSPRVDEDGKPINFLDVDVRSHLAFYRAGIAAITEEDEYAGLLVSMHGAGIYRQRYGLDTALGLTRAAEVQGDVDAFVAEQEAKFGGEPGERQARLRAAPALRPPLAVLLHARRRSAARRPSSRATGSSRSAPGACKLDAVPVRGEPGRLAPPRSSEGRLGVLAAPAGTAITEQWLRRAEPDRAGSARRDHEPVIVTSSAREAGRSLDARAIAAARTGEPYAGSSRSGRPTNRKRGSTTSLRLFRFS